MSIIRVWMNVLKIFIPLIIGISGGLAHAMGQKLPPIENEKIDNVQILAEFSLNASDGTTLRFHPFDRDKELRKILPPERNANLDLCKKMEIDLYTSLIELGTNLIGHQRPLTANEIKMIQKTPRCSPYDTALNLIAAGLGGDSETLKQVQITSMSLSKNKQSESSLILNTSNNKQIFFNITSDLSNIRKVSDLILLQITPQSSGQSLGISFSLKDHHSEKPSDTSRWEACQFTESIRQCRYDETKRRERCEIVTTTGPGYRWIESTSQTIEHTLEISMINSLGQSVLRGTIEDFEFDDQSIHGECIPSGQIKSSLRKHSNLIDLFPSSNFLG